VPDKPRAKEPPPAPDDPRFRRTCNRCDEVRDWVVAYCPRCGGPEFRVPKEAFNGS
jgi:hypothetical protein